jgi:hypothetical protein
MRMENNEPIQGNAPTQPSMNARSLALWIGDHTSVILNEPGQDVVGTIAMRLANASRNAGALRKGRREYGIGVAYDTEAWRNQCRPDHVYRRESFRTLGYDSRDLLNSERIDIETPLTDSRVAAYADAQLKAQIQFDPTIFQTPAHISPTAVAMENDIRLAEATIELVNRRVLREPADGDNHNQARSLFATICHRYALLDVDGYWVWAVDFEAYGIRAERMLRRSARVAGGIRTARMPWRAREPMAGSARPWCRRSDQRSGSREPRVQPRAGSTRAPRARR